MAYVVRLATLSLATSLFLASASTATAQERLITKPEDVGVSSEKVGELSKYMQSLVDDGKIAGGVTMMARHGKVVHFEAVGWADMEAKKPMRTDSIFRLASMTKPITTVAAMILWEEEKLKLDDPVSMYIPEFKNPKVLVSVDPLKTRPAKSEITIRHLLTHTSGLGYNFTDKIGPIYEDHDILGGVMQVTKEPLELMTKRLAYLPLLFDPGSDWKYGLSTDVLGRVIEKASGMTLDRFIDKRICNPLQLKDTFFNIPSEKKGRLADVYYLYLKDDHLKELNDGEALPTGQRSDYPYNESHKFLSGGGGLCSSTEDYMRFSQMLLNGGVLDGARLLEQSTVEMMVVDQLGGLKIPSENDPMNLVDQFGFGFTIYSDDNAIKQLRGAYAWFGFWNTSFRISPHGDWIVVTMTQSACEESDVWARQYEEIAAESIID